MTLQQIEAPSVAAALADIERQLEALGGPGDVLRTDNAQATYYAMRSTLWNRRQAITTNAATLAQVEPRIEADERWEKDLIAIRAQLNAELEAGPPRIRTERELAVQQALKLSVKIIDFGKRCNGEWTPGIETLRLGALLIEKGYRQAPPEPNTNQVHGEVEWHGSVGEVQHRLRELRARRDDARKRLDDALREA